MILKEYQSEALDWLETFFKRCKASSSPSAAYEETTREWCGTALRYHPLPRLPHVPYVCLRIPTGGGKTLVGGMAVERANRSLLFTRHSITLWLVPSEPIREQTLRALRSPSDLLHQSVTSSLGEVTILEIEEALRVTPAVLDGSNVFIVATMQAFKQEDMERLNVYKQSGYLMDHFNALTDPAAKGNQSLVDVLRLRHPFVVVDEAHNQGTPLAFETLARFEPSAILELTATPDRSHQPSNVLFSVGASTLQAAEMIKMPLELVRREHWQDALRDAIACLNKLQTKADAEQQAGGDYLQPIMLLQAERHDEHHETLTPEKVKQALLEDFGVPAEQVAIATGTTDEIAGEKILEERSKRRFIITIDKLREGWDCPFAYVLCSFRNTNSATAAEQVLGRILRMPGARRKLNQELNEAYAFVTSADLQAIVNSLRDGLVKNGFERQEAKDLIRALEEADEENLFTVNEAIIFATPEFPEPGVLPASLEPQVEMAPESGSITLKGPFGPKKAAALEAAFKTDGGKAAVREAIRRLNSRPPRRVKAPSEQGMLFAVPLLTYRQGELWEPFERTHLLQGEWKLLDYPCELTEQEFKKPDRVAQGGRFYLREESIKFEYFDNIEARLSLFDYQSDWDQVNLVSWLERNIPDENILPDEKAAFINKAVAELIERRGLTLDELNYGKFRLRAALEAKIKSAKQQAMRSVYQALLLNPDQFSVDDREAVRFEQGRYAYDWVYCGFTDLPRHFFPHIGNLKADGEEFQCALFLATRLPGVKFWVRNVERKPTSFSLQTSTDRFYPDFLCQMEDGRILAVEYKNSRDWDLPENQEKLQLGKLWEKRSSGRCLFAMPRGMDWDDILNLIC